MVPKDLRADHRTELSMRAVDGYGGTEYRWLARCSCGWGSFYEGTWAEITDAAAKHREQPSGD